MGSLVSRLHTKLQVSLCTTDTSAIHSNVDVLDKHSEMLPVGTGFLRCYAVSFKGSFPSSVFP